MYNDYLHSLVRNTAHCAALVLIFISPIHCICQKYLPLVHDSESEEGHFLPLEEGVKYLPNPLIFASYLLKRKKNADFRIISVTIFCSKDIIHTYI